MTEQARDDYDSPWKEALEQWFPQFLALLFPAVYRAIDWSRGYEFLDKELQQVVRDAELGRRYADKLVKVYTRDGREAWVLIHVEVQSQRECGFDRRMYVYNYRIFDRYEVEVVSLAVLADDDPDSQAGDWRTERWGCGVHFWFPVVRLLDLGRDWAALEASDNPFALVVMAHLKAQETAKDGQARKVWKLRLIRWMYQRGYNREQVLELFRVLDWMLRLPEGLERELERELLDYEEQTKMAYITSIERFGMERGVVQGEAAVLRRQLDRKFGAQFSDPYRQRLDGADADTLLRWSERLLDAATIDEVFH